MAPVKTTRFSRGLSRQAVSGGMTPLGTTSAARAGGGGQAVGVARGDGRADVQPTDQPGAQPADDQGRA